MTYVLYNKVPGFDKAKHEQDINGPGSHDTLRQRIKHALTNEKVDSIKTASFDSELKQLKAARVKADYKDAKVLDTDGKRAQRQSVAINDLIKTTFSIS